jgi:hypothetical protein
MAPKNIQQHRVTVGGKRQMNDIPPHVLASQSPGR